MIQFHKVRFMNFLSTGNRFTEVDLEATDNTLIVGRNGRGKSQICDALCFGLYGKAFRNINKPQLVNSTNKKNLVVEIEFTTRGKQYLVRRGIKPAIFEIYENGTFLNQSSETKDYQIILEKSILQMSYRTFAQVVILGKANYVAFMNLPAAARRSVVENLLDLDIFSVMNKTLKKDITENTEALRDNDYAITMAENSIIQKKNAIAAIQKNTDTIVADAEKRIEESEGEIKVIRGDIDKVKENMLAVDADVQKEYGLKKVLEQCKSAKTKLDTEMRTIKTDLEWFEHTESCSSCGQKISEETKKNAVDGLTARQDEVKLRLEVLEEERQKADNKLIHLNAPSERYRALENKITSLNAAINAKNSYIKGQQADIDKIASSDMSELELQYGELVKKRDLLLEVQAGLMDERETMDIAVAMLKDDGIKNRIIQQYIPLINTTIQSYLAIMDFNVHFTLDAVFNEKVLTRDMEDFSYNSFSEGEKARIELALLLTWRHIARIRNSASTNILFLDEVFDGSMDAEGGDDTLAIIEQMAGKSHVFVISHKNDSYVERFQRTLKAEKKGGFSVLKEI